MSRAKSRTAVLNQTIYPHDFNTGITVRTTDVVMINKNLNFIDNASFEKLLLSYFRKLGIEPELALSAINDKKTIFVIWRKRNVAIRVDVEGDAGNLAYKVYAQFYTPGYIMNGYDADLLVYELFTAHMPSAIISPNIGDHYCNIYTTPFDELKARIAAGDPIVHKVSDSSP